MGNGRWSASDWKAYARANIDGMSREEVFTSQTMSPAYDPARIGMRESRDSADNPRSTPIILASDVTGSMGMIAHKLMQDGLNRIATEIYARKPVSDPHVMVMAVGDAKADAAPLQVTQFEADIRVAEQVRALWLEGGGGGNGGESYSLAHLFAGEKTATDAWEKRCRKGYLFTIGDEPVHDGVTAQEMRSVLGLPAETDIGGRRAADLALERYEVFHIVLMNEGVAVGGHADLRQERRRARGSSGRRSGRQGDCHPSGGFPGGDEPRPGSARRHRIGVQAAR